MSENNHKVWTWTPMTQLFTWLFHFEVGLPKTLTYCYFISENSSLLSKKYDFLLGKATYFLTAMEGKGQKLSTSVRTRCFRQGLLWLSVLEGAKFQTIWAALLLLYQQMYQVTTSARPALFEQRQNQGWTQPTDFYSQIYFPDQIDVPLCLEWSIQKAKWKF